MRYDFSRSSIIAGRKLGPEDWSIYREHLINTNGIDSIIRFCGEDTPEKIQSAMGDPIVFFGLFKEDHVIGTTAINYVDGDAYFCGSLIRPEYRNQGYGDYLYEMRMRYLKEIGYEGPVLTEIFEMNKASLKVAKRNSFEEVMEVKFPDTETKMLILQYAA